MDYRADMPPGDDIGRRDELFMEWAVAAFKDLKQRRVTRTEAAGNGRISRNQTYQWEGRGSKGYSRPMAENLKRFCIANGLDWRIPFRIFGWDASGRPVEDPVEMPPAVDLDRRIRLIEVRLSQDPPAEERQELDLKLVRARRARDAQRLADELRAEIEFDEGRREA
jgi:hypothetical protein